MVMPAPGAVWPAMVTSPCGMWTSPLIVPETRKTMMRGPGWLSAHCRLPTTAPEAESVVTRST